jgi:hypothetical protein
MNNDSKNNIKRIQEIDKKLEDMRVRYKSSSPSYQEFLKGLATLLKEEREGLEK